MLDVKPDVGVIYAYLYPVMGFCRDTDTGLSDAQLLIVIAHKRASNILRFFICSFC
nr:MAG TPA: hypothetical protein [Caudoviricetes sp.]